MEMPDQSYKIIYPACSAVAHFRNIDGLPLERDPSTMRKHQRRRRAPRVSVPNQEQAIVAVGPTQVIGILCKLSVNGGSVRLPKPLPQGTLAEVTLKTTSGKVSGAVEFLRTAPGSPRAQGFRFIQMDSADRKRLQVALQQMREQGFGEQSWGTQPLGALAQRTLSMAKKSMTRFLFRSRTASKTSL